MSGPRERAVRALIAEIADGRAGPGSTLPSAAELASEFGMSLETARGVISYLETSGLVSRTADGTLAVSPEARWNVLDPDVLAAMLESDQGPAILAEYLEARRVLETIAAGLAAERATARDLGAMSDALARMAAAADEEAEEEFHRADVEFHHALLAAGANRPLELAADPLRPALCTARRPLARPALRRERGLPEHQRILAAVARGDADAARRAMTEHLDTVESYLREYARLVGARPRTCAKPDAR
jgi:DNA-binding FadR family transcriptional regulator